MDDSIRDMRARAYAQSAQGNEPASNDVNQQQQQQKDSQLFNFGKSSRKSDDLQPELSTRKPFVGSEDSDENDEEIMKRQLERRESQPYSFVVPKGTSGEFIPRSDHFTAESKEPDQYDMPGCFPANTEPSATDQKEQKPKEEAKPTFKRSSSDSDKTCRICFCPSAPDDKLISPCKCRGTSKWIHLSCLTQWRLHSRNNKSFYQCDQCHYRYSFRRTQFAEVLLSRYTLLILTALSFAFSSFIGGFFVKFLLFLIPADYLFASPWSSSSFFFFYTPLDAGTDILSAAAKLVPTVPNSWRDIFVIDIWHFIQGVISMGVIGVIGVLGTGGIFSLRTFGGTTRRAAGRRRGDGLGAGDYVFILVILLGCGKVAVTMWSKVKGAVKRRLARLGERILEVDPDRP